MSEDLLSAASARTTAIFAAVAIVTGLGSGTFATIKYIEWQETEAEICKSFGFDESRGYCNRRIDYYDVRGSAADKAGRLANSGHELAYEGLDAALQELNDWMPGGYGTAEEFLGTAEEWVGKPEELPPPPACGLSDSSYEAVSEFFTLFQRDIDNCREKANQAQAAFAASLAVTGGALPVGFIIGGIAWRRRKEELAAKAANDSPKSGPA